MPYRSLAQARFFHSPGAKRAGISKATVKEFDQASKGRKLPAKAKKKPVIAVDNKMKGSYGETILQKGKPPIVKINVKKHKGNKAELADTIEHELMHAKHPKMHEKTVYKKMKGTMSEKQQDKSIAKLRQKKLNYKSGAIKRKLKIGPVKTQAGDLITKSREHSQENRTAIMGAV